MLKQLDILIGFAVVMSVVSLLITIITQIVSSLLGLRGRNLADALEAMAQRIDPDIDKEVKGLAKKLADQVLTHPAISDSALSIAKKWPVTWKRASAIRPDELLEILERIAGLTPGTAVGDAHVAAAQAAAETAKNTADAAIEAAAADKGNSKKKLEAQKTKKTSEEISLKLAATRLLRATNVATPATTAALAAINAQLPALAAAQGAAVIAELNAATNVALANLEKWFNSAQDRAKQWFAMHARIATVIAAIIAAFGLQLDSFKLINRISSDSELRARLVAGAPALQKQAQEVFDAADPKSLSLHTNIMAELNQKYPGITNFLTVQTNLTSLEDAAPWISNGLAMTPFSNKIDRVIGDYTATAAKVSRKRMDELTKTFGTISDEFGKTGIELIPVPYPKAGEWSWPFAHLLGILASAGLLSLGAPFWFNTLKSLTNLKPLLAQQIDKNQTTTKVK